MEDKNKPVLIIGSGKASTEIIRVGKEKGVNVIVVDDIKDPFGPEPLPFTRLNIPQITPNFIEKPRKKRRQDLFKR